MDYLPQYAILWSQTGWPCVSILWMDKTASLIGNFFFGVVEGEDCQSTFVVEINSFLLGR